MSKAKRKRRLEALEQAVRRREDQKALKESPLAQMPREELMALYDRLLEGPLEPEEEARLEAMDLLELTDYYVSLLRDF
ncbi:MAG: hypothetical protein SFU83_18300 [Meiothermus sp.]|nr:hypothetical protein [Meiothermus sp.]